MDHEEILAHPLVFHSIDEMHGSSGIMDWDFCWAGDTERLRRVCLRFNVDSRTFAIGTRSWGDGNFGGWDFLEFLAAKHVPRLIALLPPEEVARLTIARMGMSDG